jgi:hypothetical protein
MTSWQVRLATTLAWLGVLPGLACFVLAYKAFRADGDLLMFVMPIVMAFLLGAGLVITQAGVTLALRLQRRDVKARLHAFLTGACMVLMGVFLLFLMPLLGLFFLLYGGTLAALMTTSAAAAELGPWRQSFVQPAPWGSTPGTGLWAPSPPQPGLHPSVPPGPVQGPWAPDPTTLPWFSWKDHSGPRAPWWQTWQAGLAQGIPLWEALVLGAAFGVFALSLVCVLVPAWRSFALVGVPATIGVVALLEQRMRQRLAGRR